MGQREVELLMRPVQGREVGPFERGRSKLLTRSGFVGELDALGPELDGKEGRNGHRVVSGKLVGR